MYLWMYLSMYRITAAAIDSASILAREQKKKHTAGSLERLDFLSTGTSRLPSEARNRNNINSVPRAAYGDLREAPRSELTPNSRTCQNAGRKSAREPAALGYVQRQRKTCSRSSSQSGASEIEAHAGYFQSCSLYPRKSSSCLSIYASNAARRAALSCPSIIAPLTAMFGRVSAAGNEAGRCVQSLCFGELSTCRG